MRINSINSLSSASPVSLTSQSSGVFGSEPFGKSFSDTIKDAVNNVNDLQTGADQVASKVAAGEPVEVHQAMLSMQKASMALQFTVQVRNKVLDAYQEVMRMQV